MAIERIGWVHWDQEHGALIGSEFANALFRSFHGKRVRVTISEVPEEEGGRSQPVIVDSAPMPRPRGRPRMRGQEPTEPPPTDLSNDDA